VEIKVTYAARWLSLFAAPKFMFPVDSNSDFEGIGICARVGRECILHISALSGLVWSGSGYMCMCLFVNRLK